MKSLTTLLVCLFLLTGLSAQTEVPIVPPNTNAASGTGTTSAAQSVGDSLTITITSPQNLASITIIKINGKAVKWTAPVIDPKQSVKEVRIAVEFKFDTPAGATIEVEGTTVSSGPSATVLTVTG